MEGVETTLFVLLLSQASRDRFSWYSLSSLTNIATPLTTLILQIVSFKPQLPHPFLSAPWCAN